MSTVPTPLPAAGARPPAHTLVLAPMMARTDEAFRWMLRHVTRHTLLTTEMVATRALLHGDRDGLAPVAEDGPVAYQLGGNDPAELAECARIVVDRGYDEVDLNCGCPSDRATEGTFGACLMERPELVAAGVAAMKAAVDVPVTVKCRIGTDRTGSYAELLDFVDRVVAAGADRVHVHARIAVLGGLDGSGALSTRANRSVPPLRHDDVRRLKAERPDVPIVLNGGIRTLDEVEAHLAHVDGVMLGRAAYDDPYLFAAADQRVFGDTSEAALRPPARTDVVRAFAAWSEDRFGAVLPKHVDHLGGWFHGVPGSRRWRQLLADLRRLQRITAADVDAALARLPDEALAA
ncbi:MAG: tRNA dihydrouridine(20/20a) synthase DusA [Actinomycetes bacterium]